MKILILIAFFVLHYPQPVPPPPPSSGDDTEFVRW